MGIMYNQLGLHSSRYDVVQPVIKKVSKGIMYNQVGLYSSFMKKRVDEFLQLHKFMY